jgi:uncharacterized membrane protein (UPF0182 family)
MGNQIAMEENLEASLGQLFGSGSKPQLTARTEAASAASAPGTARDTNVRGLADQALQQYGRALELLRQGNFAGYGEELKRLEGTLKALRERAR